jgi:hypothetical protein
MTMKISPDDSTTHRARAVDPQQFRAQATGIGMTRTASLATGSARAQRVVDQTDPQCLAAVPEAEGLPARTQDMLAGLSSAPNAVAMTTSPGRFKRRGG